MRQAAPCHGACRVVSPVKSGARRERRAGPRDWLYGWPDAAVDPDAEAGWQPPRRVGARFTPRLATGPIGAAVSLSGREDMI